MRSRLGKWLVVAALTCAIGGHWTLLQSVAWVTMAVNYSQTAPLNEALAKTFDGKHPCPICKLVTEGKKSERQQVLEKIVTKIDFFLTAPAVVLYPPKQFRLLPSFSHHGVARAD